ncbi:MAG: RHS repeat-associated core domain-containing protein [Paucimonas sp.]|jgi:RHS repeat-associated protein|nr:RHS repeat-associated core domain-containing protein [Paucimonas sp.]
MPNLGFNGELPEPVTGHYLLGNGYRAYSPVLMTFLQPDSWSPFGAGGLNAYAYCEGDSVNAVDPTGHWPLFGRVRFNNMLKTPAFSPHDSRPSSPFTGNALASQYLVDNVAEQATIVPLVAVTSPRGLAPALALPSRSISPSPQTSAQASRPHPSLASSGAHTSAKKHHPSNQITEIRRNEIASALPDMIDSNNAKDILALAGKDRYRKPVLRELLDKLPLTDQDRANSIELRVRHLNNLASRARYARDFKRARFYDALQPIAADRRSPRSFRPKPRVRK